MRCLRGAWSWRDPRILVLDDVHETSYRNGALAGLMDINSLATD
jgi:hypothetical protein